MGLSTTLSIPTPPKDLGKIEPVANMNKPPSYQANVQILDQTSDRLKGKVILITGGTSGLGAESAIALARHSPARIYIGGRREQAAREVTERIREEQEKWQYPNHENDGGIPPIVLIRGEESMAEEETTHCRAKAAKTEIIFLPMDLADPASVSAAADRVLNPADMEEKGTGKTGPTLGWMACDAFGMGAVTRWARCAESKLAGVVYVRELARRHPRVTSVSVNPGFVDTGMVQGMRLCDRVGTRVLAGASWLVGVVSGGGRRRRRRAAGGEGLVGRRGPMVAPKQGAENQVWACLVDKGVLRNGGYYEPVGVLCGEIGVGRLARDRGFGARVWAWTEAEVGRWL